MPHGCANFLQLLARSPAGIMTSIAIIYLLLESSISAFFYQNQDFFTSMFSKAFSKNYYCLILYCKIKVLCLVLVSSMSDNPLLFLIPSSPLFFFLTQFYVTFLSYWSSTRMVCSNAIQKLQDGIISLTT